MSFSDDILAKRGTWQLIKTVGRHDLSVAQSGHIDQQGRLWLQLKDVLLCTDGQHVIRSHSPDDIAGHTGSLAGFSQNDKYWWITQDARLLSVRLSDGEVEDHTDNMPLLDKAYWLWASQHEDILIGLPGKLIRYNGTTASILDVPSDENGKLNYAALSPNGQLWITSHLGLHAIEAGGVLRLHEIPSDDNATLWEFMVDADQSVWMNVGRRLMHLKQGRVRCITSHEIEFSLSSNPLLIDSEGNSWFCLHYHGTLIAGRSGTTFIPFEDTPGAKCPKCVVEDKTGAFWFIGVGNGIMRYDPQMLDIVQLGYLETSAMGSDGKLRFTAASRGLLEYDGTTVSQLCDKVPTRCFSLSIQANNLIHIASLNGLFIVDPSNPKLLTPDQIPGLQHIPETKYLKRAEWDHDGCLWLNYAHALYRSGKTGVHVYNHHDLGFRAVPTMFCDSKERLWFMGNCSEPVITVDAHGFTTLREPLGDWTGNGENSRITSCAEDGIGYLSIGTTDGVVGRLCMETGAVERIATLEGDPNIRHIRHDADGRIWLATTTGLFIGDSSNTYRMTEAALLPSRRIVATYAHEDGAILIVTELGLCKYRPKRHVHPQVFIDQVVADRTYQQPAQSLVCEVSKNLEISLGAVNMKPGPLKYQYRMPGAQDDWTDTWQEHFRFFDLPIGNYRFEARAIDQDLVLSSDYASVDIEIVPDSRETHIAELEGELHIAEDFAANIIRSMSEAVIVLDTEGRIAKVNTAALKLFGYGQGDLEGKSAESLFPATGVCPIDAQGIERLRQNGNLMARELDMQMHDGNRLPVIFVASCMHARNGELQGFVLTASDISKYKIMQSQMLQSQKMDSLGVLAGGIAHDFNNLLGIILGNAELVLPALEKDPTNYNSILDIVAAGEQAAKLCSEMLAYSGKGQHARAALDLTSIVKHNANLFKSSISKKIVTESNLASDLPTVWADETQLMQIVMNLVINAADAIGDNTGVISLSTSLQEITDHASELEFCGPPPGPGTYVRLEVSDTGCGMDQDTLLRIFEPFFTTKFTGRGLGLSAIHGIVKSHNGAIRVESTPGSGTSFQIFIPVYQEHRYISEATDEADEHEINPGVALVVDDEAALRTVARRMLETHGFACIEAVDGLDGLEKLQQNLERIDLVLLDVTMPRMDGMEAYLNMRQISPQLPIVIVSGFNESDMADRFPNDQRLEFLHKPFKIKTFSAIIGDLIQEDRTQLKKAF